jgi:hypothetical protein
MLADLARLHRPMSWRSSPPQLIEQLDQDGPPPDDTDQLVNELHLSKSRTGGGGRIKGQLDASTFDVVVRAIRAAMTPAKSTDPSGLGRDTSLGQRQAEALGAICEHALDDGYLPAEGGERPHMTAILNFETMRTRLGVRSWSSAATPPPANYAGCCATRRSPQSYWAATASRWTWAARSGVSPPRNAKPSPPATVAAPIPAATERPIWCEVHHIKHWLDGGRTDINNLVMLCREHHRILHDSYWSVRIRDGQPEFIPPRWADFTKHPAATPEHSYRLSGSAPQGLWFVRTGGSRCWIHRSVGQRLN